MLPWYSPWLKVSLALRMALTYPWDANAWAQVQQHGWIPRVGGRAPNGFHSDWANIAAGTNLWG